MPDAARAVAGGWCIAALTRLATPVDRCGYTLRGVDGWAAVWHSTRAAKPLTGHGQPGLGAKSWQHYWSSVRGPPLYLAITAGASQHSVHVDNPRKPQWTVMQHGQWHQLYWGMIVVGSLERGENRPR